jgi:hypothetical protein
VTKSFQKACCNWTVSAVGSSVRRAPRITANLSMQVRPNERMAAALFYVINAVLFPITLGRQDFSGPDVPPRRWSARQGALSANAVSVTYPTQGR